MKNILSIPFVCLVALNFISGQSYTLDFTSNESLKKVHLNIDLEWSQKGIFVEKELVNVLFGEVVKQNSLVLIGDFIKIGENIELDYSEYNYFFIPFDPEIPFYNLNQSIPENISQGTLYLDNSLAILEPGDLTFWCTCGGHNQDSTDPGGCLSSLVDDVVECIKDGDCSNHCIGKAIEHQRITSGGGILIQTSKSKWQLVHNFNSN